MEFTARQIADFLQGTIVGDPDTKVSTFSKIEEGAAGTITFLSNLKYEHFLYTTDASIVLVNKDFKIEKPAKATLIQVDNAYASLAALLQMVQHATQKNRTGIDPLAFVSTTATLGEDCYVGAFVFIGENAKIGKGCQFYPNAYIGENTVIGDNCIVYPNVTINYGTEIGNNCIFQPGCVIGGDGFGFAPVGETYQKIPQMGNVCIEDDVEVGANTTIDRAVMGSTIIHKGVKLDNLIQVAHNVEIGENTVMASQVGISGSVKVGKHCMFGGQAGLAGHITIADHVNIGAQAGVIGNIEEGASVLGAPAIDARTFFRSSAIFKKLPEMYRTIGQLQKEIENLKKELNK